MRKQSDLAVRVDLPEDEALRYRTSPLLSIIKVDDFSCKQRKKIEN